ncbi:MAG: sn-glycerol-3-phosphate ABC transporter ATP-binding protein UgpC [Devosia nanyangense]|uniref:Sn-glycerol-3-phosphate ABC transporter ATP-binding protein UgpC n=1 Tax=Devosia nanyangense TaxID=1228055 RepID=A0A933NZX2_9HYPH|nr:sn-glycerol-3-phosphate ABC transporter ATP-binding protein UgpC [Devosia nanyangense]
MSGLKLRGVRKSFGAIEVIKGVDLDIESKEFVVFVGPSGCGKSTLLRMIAGLEPITAGDLEIGGARMNDVDPSKRGIAMVFQTYALYPHMTVRENMGFALRFAGVAKPEIARQVDEAARILELGPLMNRRPKELSGGQRQRVAIGRAIVRHPQVFLFDEPLSNLDAELRVHMRIELARLHKELATTIIYVTHDQVEAMTLADKIVVLRDGSVAQVGTPLQLYDDPDNLFVAGFIGSPKMNFLSGVVAAGGSTVRLPDYGDQSIPVAALRSRPADGTPVTVGLRPDHFKRGGAAHLDLNVELIEHLGSETYAYARFGKGEVLTIATQNDRDLKAGARLAAHFDPASALLFDAAGQRIR